MLAVIGPAASVHVAVALTAGSILPSPVTLFILEFTKKSAPGSEKGDSSTRLRKAVVDALVKPIIIAPLLGAMVSLSGFELNDLVRSSLETIGQAGGGVAAFLTGLVLSAQPFQFDRQVLAATVTSNVARPVFAFGLTRVIPTPPDIAAVAVLLSALPCGFFSLLFGVNYGVASKEAGSMVIASTVFSIVTLGIAIAILYPQ